MFPAPGTQDPLGDDARNGTRDLWPAGHVLYHRVMGPPKRFLLTALHVRWKGGKTLLEKLHVKIGNPQYQETPKLKTP